MRLVATCSMLLALAASAASEASPIAPRSVDGADGAWSPLIVRPIGVRGQLVYDTVRQRALLVSNDQMWQLELGDPPVWTPIATFSPLANTTGHHYDPSGDRLLTVVLESNVLVVYEMPLSGPFEWSVLATAGAPSGWWPGSAVLDLVARRLVLFGGITVPQTPPTIVDWRWSLDLSATPAVWTNITLAGGVERYTNSAVLDPVVGPGRGHMLVYGGLDTSFDPMGKLRVASDGGTGAWDSPWLSEGVLSVRPSMVYDSNRDRILVYAKPSQGGGVLQTIALAPSWARSFISLAGPPPSTTAGSAIYDPVNDRMWLYGSVTREDLWSLSLQQPAWTDFTTLRRAGWEGSLAAHDVAGRRIVVLGDGSSTSDWNDVSTLALGSPEAWKPLAPSGTPPPPRNRPSGIFDPVRNRLLVFGGHDDTHQYLNDVWELTLGPAPSWRSLAPSGTPPSVRHSAACVYDPLRDRMLVFGGDTENILNQTPGTDVWELSLGDSPAWSLLSPSGPTPVNVRWPRAVYDPIGDRMLVFPTRSTPVDPQVWALSLAGAPAWQSLGWLPTNTMFPAYDAARQRVVGIDAAGNAWAMPVSYPNWTPLSPTGLPPSQVSNRWLFYDGPEDRMVYDQTLALAFGGPLAVGEGARVPALELAPARPNPTRREALLTFRMPRAEAVSLTIVDVSGRTVRRIRPPAAIQGTIAWDLRNDAGDRVPPGLYFCVLSAGIERRTRRVVVAQ